MQVTEIGTPMKGLRMRTPILRLFPGRWGDDEWVTVHPHHPGPISWRGSSPLKVYLSARGEKTTTTGGLVNLYPARAGSLKPRHEAKAIKGVRTLPFMGVRKQMLRGRRGVTGVENGQIQNT